MIIHPSQNHAHLCIDISCYQQLSYYVILIFSKSYLWSKSRYLPCGKMEPGEDISEAAKREVVGRFFYHHLFRATAYIAHNAII